MPSKFEDILRTQYNLDDDQIKRIVDYYVAEQENVSTPLTTMQAAQPAAAAGTDQKGWWEQAAPGEPPEPPKDPDNAMMDFWGNFLWGTVSSATMGLAEFSPELKKAVGHGAVDPFFEESGWGMSGRAVGEALGFFLPLGLIGKGTKGVVKALSGASTKNLTKKATKGAVKSLQDAGYTKSYAEKILGETLEEESSKKFIGQISHGLKASDATVRATYTKFNKNIGEAFSTIMKEGTGKIPNPKLISQYTDDFMKEFIGPDKRHINGIAQWFENQFNVHGNEGLKRFAGKYLAKAAELSTDFMIYNQVTSAIESWRTSEDYNPLSVAKHTLAFTAVLPFIEMIPGGKSALAGNMRNDFKLVKQIMGKKIDYKKFSDDEVSQFLKMITRGTEIETSSIAKDVTRYQIQNGTVPRETALKIIEKGKDIAFKDLRNINRREAVQDIVESIPRMAIGSAFFNSDLVTNADLWKNTSPQELATHLLIGAWFMRKRGLPISQEAMAKSHVTGADFRSKLELASQFGYDAKEIKAYANKRDVIDVLGAHSMSLMENKEFQEVAGLFNKTTELGQKVLKESDPATGKGSQVSDRDAETWRKLDDIKELHLELILPLELQGKDGETKVDFDALTKETINELHARISSIESPRYDLGNKPILDQEGNPIISTIGEITFKDWKRQLTFNSASGFFDSRVDALLRIAKLANIEVEQNVATGKYIFPKLNIVEGTEPFNIKEVKYYQDTLTRASENGKVEVSDKPFEVKRDTFSEEQLKQIEAEREKLGEEMLNSTFGRENVQNYDLQMTEDLLWKQAEHNESLKFLEFTYRLLSSRSNEGLSREDIELKGRLQKIFEVGDGVYDKWSSYDFEFERSGKPSLRPKDSKDWEKMSEQEKIEYNEVKDIFQQLHNIAKIGKVHLNNTHKKAISYEELKSLADNLRERKFFIPSIGVLGGTPYNVAKDYFWKRVLQDTRVTPESIFILEQLRAYGLATEKDGKVLIGNKDTLKTILMGDRDGGESLSLEEATKVANRYGEILELLSPITGSFINVSDTKQPLPTEGTLSGMVGKIHEVLPGMYEKKVKAELKEFEKDNKLETLGEDWDGIKKTYDDIAKSLADPRLIDATTIDIVREPLKLLERQLDLVLKNRNTLSNEQRGVLDNLNKIVKGLTKELTLEKAVTSSDVNLVKRFAAENILKDKTFNEMFADEVGPRSNAKDRVADLIDTISMESAYESKNRGKTLDTIRSLKVWLAEQLQKETNIETTSFSELYTEYITATEGKLGKLRDYVRGLKRKFYGTMTNEEYTRRELELAEKYKEILTKPDIVDQLSLHQFAQKYDSTPGINRGLKDDNGQFSEVMRNKIKTAETSDQMAAVRNEIADIIRASIEAKHETNGKTATQISQLVKNEIEKFTREFPTMQLKIKGRTKRKSVRLEIHDGQTYFVLSEKSTMVGAKDALIEYFQDGGGIKAYDLFDTVFYGANATPIDAIREIDGKIKMGYFEPSKEILRRIQQGESHKDIDIIGQQKEFKQGGYIRVEFGQGTGLLIEKNNKGFRKIFDKFYKDKEQYLIGRINRAKSEGNTKKRELYETRLINLKRFFEGFIGRDSDALFKESEFRVMARMMYYDKINTAGFEKLLDGFDNKRAFMEAQASIFKYVHLSEADLFPRADPKILEGMLDTEISFNDGLKIFTGVDVEVRNAIRSFMTQANPWALNTMVIGDEPANNLGEKNKNIGFALNVRGLVQRQALTRLINEGSKNQLTFDTATSKFLDRNGNVVAKKDWTPKMRTLEDHINEVEGKYDSLDSSAINGQTYLSLRAARVIFALLGKGLFSGHGGVKPAIAQNSTISTLIGKTNFVYDREIAIAMEAEGVDVLMGESVAKSFSGTAKDISQIQGFNMTSPAGYGGKDPAEWNLSNYVRRAIHGTPRDHESRINIKISDIFIGPASKEHGGAFLPSIFAWSSIESQTNLKKRSGYDDMIKNYTDSRTAFGHDGIGMGKFLSKMAEDEYHSMETGSFGIAGKLVSYGVDSNDPLIQREVMDWHHSRFIERFYHPDKGAIGASSVSRASTDNYDPLFKTKDFGRGVERRQVAFGDTTVSYHVGKQKFRTLEDIALSFELRGRDILATYDPVKSKWRFTDPTKKDWKIDRKANKTVIDGFERSVEVIAKEIKKGYMTVYDVVEYLKAENQTTGYEMSLLAGVYRIPRAHMSDVAINKIRGFGSKEDGNTQTVNALELATKHQADHDVDKFNTTFNLGHETFTDLFKKAGIVLDAYPEKGKHLEIDMFENGKELGAKAGTSSTNIDGVGLHKQSLVQARKLTGQIVKLQGTLTYLTNLKTNAFGETITDLLGIDGKAIGQRLNNIIQSNMDIFKGMSALSLMENRTLMKYILFDKEPDAGEFKTGFAKTEEKSFGGGYKPLFDNFGNQKIKQDAILELVAGLGKMSAFFSGTYEYGKRQKSEFKQIKSLYYDTQAILADPTKYVVTKLANRIKYMDKDQRGPEYRALAKEFFKTDKETDARKIIEELRKGNIPELVSDKISFGYADIKNSTPRQLMKLSHSGHVIEGIGSQGKMDGGGSIDAGKNSTMAIDFFNTYAVRDVELLLSFGPLDRKPVNKLIDRVLGEIKADYTFDLKEEQHLTVLSASIEKDLEFASTNFLAAKGDKRKTPFELDGLRARVESLSVVKNYIDNKFLERAVPGEKSAQVKFHSIHKDSKNYEQEYKPSLPKATEYVYEIRTSKAKDWKELLEEKGERFLEDFLVYRGTATEKYSVKLYKGKRYAILKNPIKLQHVTNNQVVGGKAMFNLVVAHFNEDGGFYNKYISRFSRPGQREVFMEEVANLKYEIKNISSRAQEATGNFPLKKGQFWGWAGQQEKIILEEFFKKHEKDIEPLDLAMMLLDPEPVFRELVKAGKTVQPSFKVNRRLFRTVVQYLEDSNHSPSAKRMVEGYSGLFKTYKYGISMTRVNELRPTTMYEKVPFVPGHPEFDNIMTDMMRGVGPHLGTIVGKASNIDRTRVKSVHRDFNYSGDAQKLIELNANPHSRVSKEVSHDSSWLSEFKDGNYGDGKPC